MMPIWTWNERAAHGGAALITLLFISGIALTVALTAHSVVLPAIRSASDRTLSDRTFAAAESGATDGMRRAWREPGLSVLPDLSLDGITVTRTIETVGGIRTVTATATVSSVTAVVRGECATITGACTFRRE